MHEGARHDAPRHDATHESVPAASLAGLSVSDRGYTLVPTRRVFPAGTEGSFEFGLVGRGGDVVTDFTEQHEHRMHLIVVRRDLAHFQHVHPTMGPDGTWSTELRLPEAGVYRAFADFVAGTDALTLGVDLFSPGAFEPRDLPASATTVEADGYEVDISGPTRDVVGPVLLTLTVRRPGGGLSLTPLMGALGHLVILREGDLAFAHAHPAEAEESGRMTFHASFPSLGRYRLFLQFADSGGVHTAGFTRDVSDREHQGVLGHG